MPAVVLGSGSRRRYRPQERQLSSWQCDRVVEVPGQALSEAGAYVLAAEANGQTAYVPLLVDPLSLTLRRCRDGVFVLVSDREGKEPIAGASIHGKGMQGEAVTDAQGRLSPGSLPPASGPSSSTRTAASPSAASADSSTASTSRPWTVNGVAYHHRDRLRRGQGG